MASGTPYVSLQRTLAVLLIIYSLSILGALLVGASLLAHVTPFSECILFCSPYGDKIFYGSEWYCYITGSLFILSIIGSIALLIVTFLHRRALKSFYNSGNFTKQDAILTISSKQLWWHVLLTMLVSLLTLVLTSGYQVTCNIISAELKGILDSKLNQDPNLYRGERIDERFTDDSRFWRYTGKISNPFGGTELYSLRLSCRTIFTDPEVHQKLHNNHVERYSSYFGYWYQTDLYSYNSRYQATLTNTLLEASLAGGWLSVLIWGGSLVFILIQRHYLKKEKRQLDKVSLHSGMVDGSFRKDGSVFSGAEYYSGNQSTLSRGTFQRGGIRGSNSSMKSVRSRRDVDDLAFASLHGVGAANGTMTPRTPSSTRQTTNYQPQSVEGLPVNHMDPNRRSSYNDQQQFVGGLPVNHLDNNSKSSYYNQQSSPDTTTHEERNHMETEIM